MKEGRCRFDGRRPTARGKGGKGEDGRLL
ncbi:hypothetical protein A2U01_0012581, partial [Trifolium medium]|nr:hypothetical protein [Trifolium medium]